MAADAWRSAVWHAHTYHSKRYNGGQTAAAINYNFPTADNDYVVFLRDTPAPIPGTPHELAIWAYGDGSANQLKVWLRDAEGELLQYNFGATGAKGWHQLHAPLAVPVGAWDRISPGGNGKLDFPVSVAGLVLDDAPDSFSGRGTIYIDDLTAIGGAEAYNLRVQRADTLVDVLWSPDNVRVKMAVDAAQAEVTERDGATQTLTVTNGLIDDFALADAPRYLVHVAPALAQPAR